MRLVSTIYYFLLDDLFDIHLHEHLNLTEDCFNFPNYCTRRPGILQLRIAAVRLCLWRLPRLHVGCKIRHLIFNHDHIRLCRYY